MLFGACILSTTLLKRLWRGFQTGTRNRLSLHSSIFVIIGVTTASRAFSDIEMDSNGTRGIRLPLTWGWYPQSLSVFDICHIAFRNRFSTDYANECRA